jgi:hypothetical protein
MTGCCSPKPLETSSFSSSGTTSLPHRRTEDVVTREFLFTPETSSTPELHLCSSVLDVLDCFDTLQDLFRIESVSADFD